LPRGSGNVREFPEVDRIEWMGVDLARTKLLRGQVPFLNRLLEAVSGAGGAGHP
jgi:predicted NUDIX family NTP pyrophosphohydrolase